MTLALAVRNPNLLPDHSHLVELRLVALAPQVPILRPLDVWALGAVGFTSALCYGISLALIPYYGWTCLYRR